MDKREKELVVLLQNLLDKQIPQVHIATALERSETYVRKLIKKYKLKVTPISKRSTASPLWLVPTEEWFTLKPWGVAKKYKYRSSSCYSFFKRWESIIRRDHENRQNTGTNECNS